MRTSTLGRRAAATRCRRGARAAEGPTWDCGRLARAEPEAKVGDAARCCRRDIFQTIRQCRASTINRVASDGVAWPRIHAHHTCFCQHGAFSSARRRRALRQAPGAQADAVRARSDRRRQRLAHAVDGALLRRRLDRRQGRPAPGEPRAVARRSLCATGLEPRTSRLRATPAHMPRRSRQVCYSHV